MVYMYHSFLIRSSADGHLGCFHVLYALTFKIVFSVKCIARHQRLKYLTLMKQMNFSCVDDHVVFFFLFSLVNN